MIILIISIVIRIFLLYKFEKSLVFKLIYIDSNQTFNKTYFFFYNNISLTISVDFKY